MFERFIWIKVDKDFKALRHLGLLTRQELLCELFPEQKENPRKGTFAYDENEEDINIRRLKELAAAMGGPARVTALLKVTVPAMHNWIRRGRIPEHYHNPIRIFLSKIANGEDITAGVSGEESKESN